MEKKNKQTNKKRAPSLDKCRSESKQLKNLEKIIIIYKKNRASSSSSSQYSSAAASLVFR
jgi:hypothetical protein